MGPKSNFNQQKNLVQGNHLFHTQIDKSFDSQVVIMVVKFFQFIILVNDVDQVIGIWAMSTRFPAFFPSLSLVSGANSVWSTSSLSFS